MQNYAVVHNHKLCKFMQFYAEFYAKLCKFMQNYAIM